MLKIIKGILAIGALAVGLSACTTADLFAECDSVEQCHYVTIAVFNEYDKVGAEIFNNPNTPVEVKKALNEGRRAAVTAIVAANEAFKTVGEIRARLQEVEDQTLVDELVVAASVLKSKTETAKAQVDIFKALIKSYE